METKIPITPEQRHALAENNGGPVEVVDVDSGSTSVLISRVKFDEMRAMLCSEDFHVRDTYDAISSVFGQAGWDDPQMDIYNEE